MPAAMKRTINWLVTMLGFVLGISTLAELGTLSGDEQWRLNIGLFVAGSVFIAGSWAAVYNRRTASFVLLGATPANALAALAVRPYSNISLAGLIVILPASFGLFWFLIDRWLWPSPLPMSGSWLLKLTVSFLICVLLVSFVAIEASAIAIFSKGMIVGCGYKRPFASEEFRGQAVFVATLHDPGFAIVKEQFWGLPVDSRFVLIAHWGLGHNLLSGATYFVDGRRSSGLLTRFLPIVELNQCGRSKPVDRAALDLRVVREREQGKGVRIIGQVTGDHSIPRRGAQVTINGPSGNISTMTDHEGIYEIANLAPGRYTLRLANCDETKNPAYYRCGDSTKSDLKPGDFWATELRTD